MSIDDAYTVERVLAQTKAGVTEIVTIDGTGPFIRKRIFRDIAHRSVWAALAECDCPRLPHVEASYETPDTFVVVCSYIPGQTLAEYMAAGAPLPASEAVRIIADVCEAIAELHRHGVVHCDITPENIVVAADGAHVIDLGIACMEHEGSRSESAHLGTWGFAAPEQYGFAKVDRRSDIYSLGRLLGYLVTGIRPDSDLFEPALEKAANEIPGIYRAIRRASSFEPSGRYQSVAAFMEDVRRADASDAAEGGAGDLQVGQAGQEGGCGQQAGSYWMGGGAGAVPPAHAFGGNAAAPAPGASLQGGTEPWGRRGGKKVAVLAAVTACACLAVVASGLLVSNCAKDAEGEPPAAAEAGASGAPSHETPLSGGEAVSEGPADVDVLEGASDSVPFSIVESGWSISEDYVVYAVVLRNESDERALWLPEVAITGYDEDGKVLFAESRTFSVVSPGGDLVCAGLAGNGTPPAKVTFEPRASSGAVWNSGMSSAECYTVSDVSYVPSDNGSGSVTGMVKTEQGAVDALSNVGGTETVCLSAVLRDKSGKIVGGRVAYATPASEGLKAAFEIPFVSSDYDSLEVYAIPWS